MRSSRHSSNPPTVKALGARPSSAGVVIPGTPHSSSTCSAIFTADSDVSSWAGESTGTVAADAKWPRVSVPRLRPPSAQYMQGWRERRGRLQSHLAAGGRNLRSAPQLARRWHPRLRPATVDEADSSRDDEPDEAGGLSPGPRRSSVSFVVARMTHRRTSSDGSAGHGQPDSSGGSRNAKVGVLVRDQTGSIDEAPAAAEEPTVIPPSVNPPSAAYMRRWRAQGATAHGVHRSGPRRRPFRARAHADAVPSPSDGPLDGGVDLPMDDPTGVFTPDEIAAAHQLKRDYGGPPSDHRHAACVARLKCEGGQIRCWRYRQPGDRFDTYALDVTMGVSLRTALTMTASQHRPSWDETTKEMSVVSAGAASTLTALHGEPSDEMVLHWIVSAPFPLQSREYVLRKRLALLPGDSNGGVLIMMRASRGPDAGYHKPPPRRTVRVVDNTAVNVFWSTPGGGTAFRSLYREDPMVSLPSWLVGSIIDKVLPRGLKALTRSAIACERRDNAREAALQAKRLLEDSTPGATADVKV